MGWKELEYEEHWNLVCSGLQATGSIGTFLVALVGLWSVEPIITYQIAQQEKPASQRPSAELQAQSTPSVGQPSEIAESFVAGILSWRMVQVESYQHIVDLIDTRSQEYLQVSFKIVQSAAVAGVPADTVDLLVVTATDPAGVNEAVQVPVNAKAMPPSQYIQCRINQGAFAMLDPAKRQKVEQAIGRYIHAYMLPKVPPAYVRPEMSLKELREAISYNQDQRREATQQIRVLSGIIDAAIQGQDAEYGQKANL
jgi:hypothetical protein